MRQKKRISLVLLAGILLLGAGLAGLLTGPELIQYAFLPGQTGTAELLEQYAAAGSALAEAFPRLTLHGMKNGVTLTAGDRSRNDVCLYVTGPGWQDVYPRVCRSGRPIAAADAEKPVIVLDADTAFLFFGEQDAVGKSVTLGDRTLEVVGVAEHSRRAGEKSAHAAWAPLGTVTGCDLMVLTAADSRGGAMNSVFRNAAEEAFGTGTLISLSKERTRGSMLLRWCALILAVWLLKRGIGRLAGLWRERTERVREENRRSYAGRLIPYAAAQLALPALLTAAAVAAGYGLAVFAVSPAYVFPEWIPEALGDFSRWGERFWSLTGEAASPVVLRTPELAEIRLWAGLVRGGTVLTLTGALLQAWNKKGTKG